MGDRITYVGRDVHKERIVVAIAEGGVRGEVREYGRIANTPTNVSLRRHPACLHEARHGGRPASWPIRSGGAMSVAICNAPSSNMTGGLPPTEKA